jgi:threonyl-tRNA synthetase
MSQTQQTIAINKLMDEFKKQLAAEATKIVEEAVGKAYTDIAPYVDDDAYANARSSFFTDIADGKVSEYEFSQIAKAMIKLAKADSKVAEIFNTELLHQFWHIQGILDQNQR